MHFGCCLEASLSSTAGKACCCHLQVLSPRPRTPCGQPAVYRLPRMLPGGGLGPVLCGCPTPRASGPLPVGPTCRRPLCPSASQQLCLKETAFNPAGSGNSEGATPGAAVYGSQAAPGWRLQGCTLHPPCVKGKPDRFYFTLRSDFRTSGLRYWHLVRAQPRILSQGGRARWMGHHSQAVA